MRKLFSLTVITLLLGLLAAPALADESRKECRDRCKDKHEYFLDTCLDSNHEQATRGRCLHMAAKVLKRCKDACKDK